MADTRQRTTWGTRFRFLTRAVGLTGVVAVAVGATLTATVFPINQWTAETLRAAADGSHGPFAKAAVITLAAGVATVAIALVVELLSGLLLMTGRRTAASTTATVGTLAAVALLVIVNAYSFTHHKRFDFTRDRQFTLAPDLADRLRTLRSDSPTTVVVLQKHRIFGTLSDDRDAFTKAAEEKVTEKVKDLVDLLRELGPRFNVVVLDTEAYGYKEQFDKLTNDAPELKAAIEATPENSIFFHANKRVQRLGFNEFLQLDKTASKDANDGRGNLVLLPQGVENFARRVLAVQERRPKVGVCVVHEWLTTASSEGTEEYSLAGLRKALAEQGFDVVDVVLKKNWGTPQREPAAYTLEESKLERLEAELGTAAARARAAAREVGILEEVKKDLDAAKSLPFADRADLFEQLSVAAGARRWGELAAAIRRWAEANGSPRITPENEPALREAVTAGLAAQSARAAENVTEAEKARREADERVRAAARDDRAVQDRREQDVKGKLARLLADVDLLVIPRYTLVNAALGGGVNPAIHTLTKEQIEVIKDFMVAGKPVLACLGSVSGDDGVATDAFDGLDRLVAERGIELGRDTVLYDAEARGFAGLQAGGLIGGSPSDIPPLAVAERPPDDPTAKPNPVAAAVRLTGRSVDQKLNLRLRAPRPVYIDRAWKDRFAFATEFVFTGPDSWNEENPFPARDGRGRVTAIPRYEPTLRTDPKWATRMAERRGPFPVGVAIESKIPAAWVNEQYGREQFAAALLTPIDGVFAAGLTAAATKLDRPTQRFVVFGSGNIFTGPKLEPPQEKLLLHSVNWLTGREDRLPRADLPAWSFPRVEMSDRDLTLWRLGTAVGLPLVAVYLGLMVMMMRRLR